MLVLFYLGCDSLFPIDLVHSNPYFHVCVFRPEHCNAVGCVMCVCMKGRESECGCLCVRWLSGWFSLMVFVSWAHNRRQLAVALWSKRPVQVEKRERGMGMAGEREREMGCPSPSSARQGRQALFSLGNDRTTCTWLLSAKLMLVLSPP